MEDSGAGGLRIFGVCFSVCQASLAFGQEIEAAVRCPHELNFAAMDSYQQARSSRLLAILKSSFLQHGRISLMISAYLESEHYSTVGMPNRCGFELLRRLALEYSLRSRSEAVALRTSLVSRSYLATSAESSQATLVADSIRKLELELSRYNRLLATLPSGFSSGLGVNEGDLVSLLLRSLR